MEKFAKQVVAGLVVVAVLLAPVQGGVSVWAAAIEHAAALPPGAVGVVGTIVGALGNLGSQAALSQALTVETQAKAAYLIGAVTLDGVSVLQISGTGGLAAVAPIRPTRRVSSDSRREAIALLRVLDAELENVNWHDLHDPANMGELIARLSKRMPEGRAVAPEQLRSAIQLLQPGLEPIADGVNPWEAYFDGVRGRADARHDSIVDVSHLVSPTDGDWRPAALAMMVKGALNVSRTALMGRKYAADRHLEHEDIRAISTRNYRAAAIYVLDNADTLPLNLDTVIAINKMLTADGLVPADAMGNPYFNGDKKFHREVQQFYDWLASHAGVAFAQHYPMELAERLHYLISHFDSFLDANGRTSRLMADLVLIKAGMAPVFYTDIGDYFKRGTARSNVPPKQRRGYFIEQILEGQKIMSRAVLHRRETLSAEGPEVPDDIRRYVENVAGHNGLPPNPEVRVSVWEFAMITEMLEAHRASIWMKLAQGLDGFSGSYKRFIAGASILEGVSIAMAATMAVYGISEFGLMWTAVAASLGILMRIPGSWVAARVKASPKAIYLVSTVVTGLQILTLPLGLMLFGPHTVGYLAVFIAGQAIYGFTWGATYGMAESTIMPRIVGHNRRTLETAKLMLTALKTVASLVFAFIVGPVINAAVGMSDSIIVYGLTVLAVLPLLASITFLDEPVVGAATAVPAAAASAAAGSKRTSLSLSETLPYMATMFTLFTFYNIYVGGLALFCFNGLAEAGVRTAHTGLMSFLTIGFYNLGGALISIGALIPKLIASLEGARYAQSSATDTSTLMKWFTGLTVAAPIYWWTGIAGWEWVNVVLAAAGLGAAMAFNRSQWMAYYQSVLDDSVRNKVTARLNNVPQIVSFIPFAILTVGQLMGLPVLPFLIAATAFCTLLLAVSWLFAAFGRRAGAP